MLKRLLPILLLLAAAPVSCRAAPDPWRVVVAAGERYVSLQDVAARYGLGFRVPPGRNVYLQSKWSSVVFTADSREMTYNGTLVWLHAPMLKLRGKWVITENDARRIVDPMMRPGAYLSGRGYKVVVLDPGHGQLDRGARGRRGVEEKGVVLDIAKRVRAQLANAGIKVYLTRENDRFIELEDRSVKAARWGADAFVSIHLNSATSRKPKGLETYVLAASGYPATAGRSGTRMEKTSYAGNRFDHSSTVLGYYLQKSLVEKVRGEDRGLRRARFVVLRNAPCPAALVECGFLSNTDEESKILTNEHREKIALGISKGILEYINTVKRAHVAEKP
jgi:N-acetylmuramoyl-L-alanine amidase